MHDHSPIRPVLLAGLCAALAGACGGPVRPPEPVVPAVPLSSEAFGDGGAIPPRYTADGEDLSPPLSWGDPPEGTRSWALVVYDPEAPGGGFDHWSVYNIPPGTRSLPEGIPPDRPALGDLPGAVAGEVAFQGSNHFSGVGYRGPSLPGGVTHDYLFRIFALDVPRCGLGPGASIESLLKYIEDHILGEGELVGTYTGLPGPGEDPGEPGAPAGEEPGPGA